MNEESDISALPNILNRVLTRAIFLAFGVFLLLWFLDAALLAVLFTLSAFILALALNPPVAWLEQRGVKRGWGTLLVVTFFAALTLGIGYLVVPRLVEQMTALVNSLPEYATQLNRRALRLMERSPEVQRAFDQFLQSDRALAQRAMPLLQNLLARIGGYSITIIGAFVFFLLLISTAIYALIQPRPLLRSYLEVFPPRLRDKAERAFVGSSNAIAGWLWSNVILGALEAVLATIALSMLGVPGAFIWGALTFFAELVPQVGSYLMMIPPVLVALAVDPMTALWVAVFYMAMMQIVGNFIAPLIRSSQMKLHPVSLLFAVLAMASAFGVLGAIIATPAAGVFKAYYDEFFARERAEPEDKAEARINRMLARTDESNENS